MKNSKNIIGNIHSIDTYSTLDGFGIRSVVFMQGCDLRCIYCHNPDTWVKGKGTNMTVKEVVGKLNNYIAYYGKNGGVTFGGGEPLLQSEFVLACVKEFESIGVKCCIETSGNVELTKTVQDLLKKLDFVICDLKFPDEESYEKYTCAKLTKTLKFLDFLQSCNIPVWLRTVIVPDINDSEQCLTKYKAIIDKYDNVIKWELLPLSKIGFNKYENLNIENRLINVKDLDMKKFKNLQDKFEIKCASK